MMQEETLREVLRTQQSKFFGKNRGLVVDNQDFLERRGRLKVVVPQVLGEAEVWALPCVPFAGKGVGFYALPPKDTPVWVEFEAGDPSYPIWTGCLWPSGDISITDLGVTSPNVFLKTGAFTLHIDELKGELSLKSNMGGSEIKMTPFDITIKSSFVLLEGAASRKILISGASVAINNGAIEVR
jgi:hypothetical protein